MFEVGKNSGLHCFRQRLACLESLKIEPRPSISREIMDMWWIYDRLTVYSTDRELRTCMKENEKVVSLWDHRYAVRSTVSGAWAMLIVTFSSVVWKLEQVVDSWLESLEDSWVPRPRVAVADGANWTQCLVDRHDIRVCYLRKQGRMKFS